MRYSPLINKVLKFVYEAHDGQVDKSGVPYVFHPFFVANLMYEEDCVVTALLHDVLEDTDKTIDDIRALGVSDSIIDALKLLTYDKKMPYLDYVRNLKDNSLATAVKLGDLAHNMMSERIESSDAECKARQKKYRDATDILRGRIPEREQPDESNCATYEIELDDSSFEDIKWWRYDILVRPFDEVGRKIKIDDHVVFVKGSDKNEKNQR